MAYRYEKTQNAGKDLIIDGFENGIAVSPYKGIANMRNLNASYYPGVAYVNYRRQQATIPSVSIVDSYSESNFNSTFPLYAGGSQQYIAQKFYNHYEANFNQCKFYLSKTGSPTGTMVATLYSSITTPIVSALVVAGGGGGGNNSAGGGGAGAVRTNTAFAVTPQVYTVTVGAGGAAQATPEASGNDGGNSVFSTITSTGGGGGGGFVSGSGIGSNGRNGGSGGGGAGANVTAGTGGTGTTGGHNGGNGSAASSYSGGGGGGAVATGSNASASGSGTGGNGGLGIASDITGSTVFYGGGGGGAGNTVKGTGGSGGGGNGAAGSSPVATAGTDGLGGGGGGGGAGAGGAPVGAKGGNGIVIVSYPTGSLTATGGVITTSGTNTIHTFSTSGSFTVSSVNYAVVSSSTINVSTLTGSPVLTTFSFASTPLNPNSYYWIGLSYLGGDASNKVNVGYGITDEYPDTTSVISTDNYVWSNNTSPASNTLIYYVYYTDAIVMGIPIQSATSPAGLNYVLDDNGNIWKQSAVNSTTFNLLGAGLGRLGQGNGGLAYWNNYIVVIGDNFIEFCGDGTDDSGVISTNWNIAHGAGGLITSPFTADTSPSQLNVSLTAFTSYAYNGMPVKFTTTGTLPSPLSVDTIYYVISVASTTVQVSLNPGSGAIIFVSTGTGIHTITGGIGTDTSLLLPLGNVSDMTFTADLAIGDTSATIADYTTPGGFGGNIVWQGASGQYNIVAPSGDNILSTFTNGSDAVSFLSPISFVESGTFEVNLLTPDITNYKAYISKVDGNLYFANGRAVGRILSENLNTVFNSSSPSTYIVDFAVVELLQPSDTVTDMTDLKSSLIVAGQKDLYVWDYVSANIQAPAPVGETISSLINILNNIYILAGQKGNIYVSNGYSAQILYKMPDFIAGIIDPVWSWGGLMQHRSKLFFQVLASSASGTKILSGVFSLNVSSTFLQQENSSGLVMEAQNSFGLVPVTSVGTGVLIDNEPSANGNDSYYSAWGSGASATGGIDYNDTSLWQNFEPVLETDIIPSGDFLNNTTFGNIEFKLDRQMTTGDQIRISYRASLTDSYTLIGTTDTTVLSNYHQSNITNSQWVQFKVEFKCASSNSSFIPLREIRMHLVTV